MRHGLYRRRTRSQYCFSSGDFGVILAGWAVLGEVHLGNFALETLSGIDSAVKDILELVAGRTAMHP